MFAKNRAKKQVLSFAAAAMAMILGGGMQLYAADKIADTVYTTMVNLYHCEQHKPDIANAKS